MDLLSMIIISGIAVSTFVAWCVFALKQGHVPNQKMDWTKIG